MTRPSLTCLVLASALLAACNRAAQEPPPNVLATQVAATLTAAPTLPASVTPPPSPTVIASATQAIPATATPTDTPTPGGSPSPTPPPLAPDDPRTGINLASPDLRDDFSARFKWFEFSDETSATNLVEDGHLKAIDNLADSYIWWSTTEAQAEDVYAEVSATIGTCAGHDSAGMAVHINGSNFDQGYALELACDGSLRLRRFITEASPATLIDWTAAPEIVKGPNATNRLGLLAKESKLFVFANGKLVGQVEDASYTSGTFGLYASAVSSSTLTVTFDDFAAWYP
jgi:hypothetical protein